MVREREKTSKAQRQPRTIGFQGRNLRAVAFFAAMILLVTSTAGCTGPCRARQMAEASAFMQFHTGANESDLREHFNQTGWETEDGSNGFYAHRYWNESLYLSAIVGATPSLVGVTIRGPEVLTPEEAEENLSAPATSIRDELATFLSVQPPTIRFDGGTQHCGAI